MWMKLYVAVLREWMPALEARYGNGGRQPTTIT